MCVRVCVLCETLKLVGRAGNSAELRAAVNELAAAVHMPAHEDVRVTLTTLLPLVEAACRLSATATATPAPAAAAAAGDASIALNDLPLGFDTGGTFRVPLYAHVVVVSNHIVLFISMGICACGDG